MQRFIILSSDMTVNVIPGMCVFCCLVSFTGNWIIYLNLDYFQLQMVVHEGGTLFPWFYKERIQLLSKKIPNSPKTQS